MTGGDVGVPLCLPKNKGSAMCFGLKERKFRIVSIRRVKAGLVITRERSHGHLQVMREDLRLTDQDEVRAMEVDIVLEAEDIPPEALDVPGKGSEAGGGAVVFLGS